MCIEEFTFGIRSSDSQYSLHSAFFFSLLRKCQCFYFLSLSLSRFVFPFFSFFLFHFNWILGYKEKLFCIIHSLVLYFVFISENVYSFSEPDFGINKTGVEKKKKKTKKQKHWNNPFSNYFVKYFSKLISQV